MKHPYDNLVAMIVNFLISITEMLDFYKFSFHLIFDSILARELHQTSQCHKLGDLIYTRSNCKKSF